MRKPAILAAILSLTFTTGAVAGEVTGTVYDQRGMPAVGVQLSLGDVHAVTGADGSYRFEHVDTGEHMIAAQGQRVAVQVDAEGATQRNIFLMSRRARTEVTGATVDAEAAEAAFADAMLLADELLSESEARGEIAWRWNDLEG